MKRLVTFVAGAALLAGSAAVAQSISGKAAEQAVEARQATMELYAFNIGLLGAMAKGEMEYDAGMAGAAASNLAKLASTDQSRFWVPGTEKGAAEDSHLLPEAFAEGSTLVQKASALTEATAALDGAAGGGLDSLRGAMGPVGEACGSCHKAYREKD